MNKDYKDDTIDAETMRDIAKSIDNFVGEIHGVSKKISSMSPSEKEELMKWIMEFSENLDLWMSRHREELLVYEKSIGNQPIFLPMKERLNLEQKNFEKVLL